MSAFHERFIGGRLVERLEDRGDGTGVRTLFDADGNVVAVEPVAGLPVAAVELTAEEKLAALVQALADAQSLEEIRQAAQEVL